LRRTLGLQSDAPVVALLPGAEYGPAKQWPTESFASLAAQLARDGWQVWVLGSQKERALGEAICAASSSGSGAHNLCGKTSLTDAIDLLHEARVAVSNDSGLMHVAAACGAHVVAIYGSSSPDMTPPLTPRADILREPQPCSPCFARTCRYDHYRCLREIDVARVFSQVRARA
ncbi:MAG: lipopolysaccharide heptosyltransferase II, partial [Pseudomonadota bacterium]